MAMYPCLSLPSLSFPSVSGAICTFNSQYAGLPLKSHTVAVTATQSGSGTPSPSNPRAISGWSSLNIGAFAVNIWDEVWENGSINNQDGTNVNAGTNRIRSKNYTLCMPSTKYYFYNGTNIDMFVYFYGVNNTFISLTQVTGEFTTPSNCHFIRFRSNDNYGTTYNNDISINYPSTDTTYHIGTSNQYATIPFGSTIYGGNYDAVSGVLTVTHEIYDLGYMTWGYTASGNRFTSSTIQSVIKHPASDSTVADIMADIYQTMSLTALRSSSSDNLIAVGDSGTISIRNTTYGTDYASFKTAMSGKYIVYELATPQTIQLPPCPIETLEVNNIWADTGDTTLQYIKLG